MKSPDFPQISYADWRRRVEAQLGDVEFAAAMTHHADGVDFEALCTATHPEFTVRISPTAAPAGPSMATSNEGLSWRITQRFDAGDPQKLKHDLKSDLAAGVDGIWLCLDPIARRGQDPLVDAGLGAGGAALYREADYAEAFSNTSGSWKTLLMDAGGCFLPSAANLVSWLETAGLDPAEKSLLFGADPLGALAREGRLPASIGQLADDMAELVGRSRESWPASRALGVSTQTYREAGAEIDQELAFSVATGVEYLRWMEKRGVGPEDTASEMVFICSTGQQVFLEIAKLRALRILWTHVLQSCGVAEPTAPLIHASILRRSLPPIEPSLNLLRVTTAGWAAIVGGADSIETPAYDWFESTSGGDRGRRLARNTQLILGLESGLGRVMDPGAGSYFLETVTQDLVQSAWSLLQQVERQGGLAESLASGWLQEAVAKRWEERRGRLADGTIPVTGVNAYPDPSSSGPAQPSPTPELLQSIRERYARQQERSTGSPTSSPTEEQSRWLWSLHSAAAGLSVADMASVLYDREDSPTVTPLKPRLDSDACTREPGKP